MSRSHTPISKPITQPRSRSQTPKSTSNERQRPVVDIIDNTNLDDFFRQPSAHELSVADHISTSFECRIHEIISDLQRRTTVELDYWSSVSPGRGPERLKPRPLNPALIPSAEVPPPSEQTDVPVQSSKAAFIPEADLVSSPLFVSSPSPFLSKPSNLAAVFKLKFSTRRQRTQPQNRPQLAITSDKQSPLFNASSTSRQEAENEGHVHRGNGEGDVSPIKPSFQSFLKRVPKPVVADARAQFRGTAIALPTPASVNRAFAVEVTPSERNRFSFEPIEAQQQQKQQPKPSSSNGLKRKPLPTDSPLLILLSAHPAFAASPGVHAETELEGGVSKVDTALIESEEDLELDRLEMLLPLPPMPVSPI